MFLFISKWSGIVTYQSEFYKECNSKILFFYSLNHAKKKNQNKENKY